MTSPSSVLDVMSEEGTWKAIVGDASSSMEIHDNQPFYGRNNREHVMSMTLMTTMTILISDGSS
jgi:hypothetical protein